MSNIKEMVGVIRGISKDGTDVMVMPITRLDCIEDSSETVSDADNGDYLPIIDMDDGGQMKKISVSNLHKKIVTAEEKATFRRITSDAISTLPTPTKECDYMVDDGDDTFPYPYGFLSVRYGANANEFVARYDTTGTDCAQYTNLYKEGSWKGWKNVNDGSNPNLLINPDFEINQRGLSEYEGAVYGLDGWKGDTKTKVEVLDNGKIRITVTDAVNTGWYALKQTLEDMPIGAHALSINVTAISGDGWYITASNTHASAHLREGVNYITVPSFTTAIVGLAIDAGAVVGDYVEFEWMQLEPGTIPTRHVKSNKALELVKCQRNYEVLIRGHADRDILGYYNIATRRCHFDIPFKVTKRVAPSLVNSQCRLVIYKLDTGELCMAAPMDMVIYTADIEGMVIQTATAIGDSVTLPDQCIVTLDMSSINEALAVSCEP